VALAALVSPNVGALWVATTIAYVLAYEWLHLSYHLPEDGPVGRLPLVRVLRRHHAIHHAPEFMQRWNFNVTLPLLDWIRGTLYRPARAAPAAARARA
jgi:sterol desaturase/sphingolipid hydroxylase (fatty acid hydroxylase superfamily)